VRDGEFVAGIRSGDLLHCRPAILHLLRDVMRLFSGPARRWLVGLLAAFLALGAHAGAAEPLADDAALEQRVHGIAVQLRCLVCQNQSIADSHAALAIDLRNQIRAQLRQGLAEPQILEFMVARYGDFVLYRPPLKVSTLVLWAGPFALLLAGLLLLRRQLLCPAPAGPAPQPDAAAIARARRLLEGTGA
jgi:cytochrome c-type biogenesis protein CcmH